MAVRAHDVMYVLYDECEFDGEEREHEEEHEEAEPSPPPLRETRDSLVDALLARWAVGGEGAE